MCDRRQWMPRIAASQSEFEFSVYAQRRMIGELRNSLNLLEKAIVCGRSDTDLICDLGDSDLLHAISEARSVIEKTSTEDWRSNVGSSGS